MGTFSDLAIDTRTWQEAADDAARDRLDGPSLAPAPSYPTPIADRFVVAALERLAEAEATAAQHARARGEKDEARYFQREANAYTRALSAWLAGLRPTPTPHGWLLPSQRPGEPPHKLTLDGDWVCTCPAGATAHWAKALIIGIEVAHDDMQQLGGEDEPEPPYIVLSSAPDGLHLTRGATTEIAHSPADVAPAIARLTPQQQLGQRLAQARTARETPSDAPQCCVPMVRDGMTWYCPKCKHWRWAD